MTSLALNARRQILDDEAQNAITRAASGKAPRRHDPGRADPGAWARLYAQWARQILETRDSPVSVAEAEGFVGLALAYAEQVKPSRPENAGQSIKELLGQVWTTETGELGGYGIRRELRQKLNDEAALLLEAERERQAEADAIAAEPEPLEDRRPGRESA